MDRGKRVIGVFLIVISIAGLGAWEKWGKPRLLYDEVLVCTENIRKGTVIKDTMLATVRMDIREKGFLKPKDRQKLVGREAASMIHKGMPLFPEYFAQAGLSASEAEGRYVLSVPEDWLESVPVSMERGDRAYFFSGRKFLTSAPVAEVDHETHSAEVVVSETQAAKLSGAAAAGEKLVMIYQ